MFGNNAFISFIQRFPENIKKKLPFLDVLNKLFLLNHLFHFSQKIFRGILPTMYGIGPCDGDFVRGVEVGLYVFKQVGAFGTIGPERINIMPVFVDRSFTGFSQVPRSAKAIKVAFKNQNVKPHFLVKELDKAALGLEGSGVTMVLLS